MTRLVLLTDGTGQDGTDERTNVAQIEDLLSNGDSRNQYLNYSPGVGTRIGEEFEGGVFGCHVYRVVNEHYAWLARCAESLQIETSDEIEIALFGFSRGAFISRLIADLLNKCGMPRDSRKASVLVDMYKKRDWDRIAMWREANRGTLLSPSINFLGCWDTVVATFGINAIDYEDVPPNVRNAAHAVAINESRPKFDYTRMVLRPGVREEFFAGNHSDVGGGYGDDQVLSRISLYWMSMMAFNAGVAFNEMPPHVAAGEYVNAVVHSEHFSKSNGYGALGHHAREIDHSRLNASVPFLPWSPFGDDEGPLNSELMVARVREYRDQIGGSGTAVV